METDKLLDIIRDDLNRNGTADRYPIRFWGMPFEQQTANTIISIKNDIQTIGNSLSVEIIDIKDWLPFDDAWITKENFRERVYGLKNDKSYILMGFSEYARFLSNQEFTIVIESLLEYENPHNNNKQRIYIPCFSLYNQVLKAAQTHPRKNFYQAFIWGTEHSNTPQIYFIKNTIDYAEYSNIVSTSRKWLGLWRDHALDPSKPIVCISNTLHEFYKIASPDNVCDIKIINTYKDLLAELYGIKNLHDYGENEDNYFKKLTHLLIHNNEKNISDVILSELNVQSIDSKNFYSVWNSNENFGKWLLLNYVDLYCEDESYLKYITQSVSSLSDDEVVDVIYMGAFSKDYGQYKEDREQLLNSIKRCNPNVSLSDKVYAYYLDSIRRIVHERAAIPTETLDLKNDIVTNLSKSAVEKIRADCENVLLVGLTSLTVKERQIVIWLLRQHFLSYQDIQTVYPELYSYLNGSINDAAIKKWERANRYFEYYRRLRTDALEEKNYDQLIGQWNSDEDNFYEWYENDDYVYPETVVKKYPNLAATFVFDGVGAEFAPYILSILKDYGYSGSKCTLAKAHIPTITSIAKTAYTFPNTWITDYDKEVVHGKIYEPVQNLESSLSSIREMVEKACRLANGQPFVITADHGATVGNRVDNKGKKYNFKDADHGGRCCKCNGKDIKSREDYIAYEDDVNHDKWAVSLNGQSLYNAVAYEVHGGATPEEVLIPVILAQRTESASEVYYEISAQKLKVSGLDKIVEFKVAPKPNHVHLKADDGTSCEMQYDERKEIWFCKLNSGIKQSLTLTAGKNSKTFTTITDTGMEDDLFDD